MEGSKGDFQHFFCDSNIGYGRSEPSRRWGIEFVSLSEQMDTSTPTGKMVFTVLGAVAELERSLIAERVKAGLRNARAKGKKLGRPKKVLDSSRIAALRRSGLRLEEDRLQARVVPGKGSAPHTAANQGSEEVLL